MAFKFSLRVALLILPYGALLVAAVIQAIRGEAWAVGLVAAVLGLAFTLGVHASVYQAVCLFERCAGWRPAVDRADAPLAAPPGGSSPKTAEPAAVSPRSTDRDGANHS